MSKEISTVIGGVVSAVAINPPLALAIATGGAILILGGSLAYKLATRGKNAKFSIGDVVKFEAEFY